MKLLVKKTAIWLDYDESLVRRLISTCLLIRFTSAGVPNHHQTVSQY